jgi:hypothetical protein
MADDLPEIPAGLPRRRLDELDGLMRRLALSNVADPLSASLLEYAESENMIAPWPGQTKAERSLTLARSRIFLLLSTMLIDYRLDMARVVAEGRAFFADIDPDYFLPDGGK